MIWKWFRKFYVMGGGLGLFWLGLYGPKRGWIPVLAGGIAGLLTWVVE